MLSSLAAFRPRSPIDTSVTPSERSGVARARIQRSQTEWERVHRAFDRWVLHRRAEDAKKTYQQYRAQLTALEGAIQTAFSRIKIPVAGLGSTSSPTTAHVFTLCARHDVRLAWIQRLWFYFQLKFDQRDDPTIAPLLYAADEIVWSCYKPPFEQLGIEPASAPLPYLEPLYSPQAILRADPPRELLWNTDDAFARGCLSALPIPVIGVPTAAVGAPWLLGLLAHEVGHHVQADLDGGEGQQVRSFGDTLKAAAALTPKPEFWIARGREVFADVFSVLAIGSAAFPVLADLLLAENTAMLMGLDSRYPAPRVRLALLDQVLRALGLPPAPDPHRVDLRAPSDTAGLPPAATLAIGDFAALPALAASALGWKTPSGLSFAQLLGWSETPDNALPWRSPALEPTGDVSGWAQLFFEGNVPVAPEQLESPRLLAGASVLAWAKLLGTTPDAEREEKMAALAQGFLKVVPTYREQKTRGGQSADPADGTALADRLMNATDDQLGGAGPRMTELSR